MNMKFNNSFPWLMACVAAFIITLLIRLMLPTTSNIQYSSNTLKIPDIPFLEKDSKKHKDSYVLVALKDIKQFEKITSQTVTWKKWPKEGISASFIAKDSDGNMLNSSYTYSNVINLFAKFPIVKGTPVTMTMLSRKRQENDEAKKLAVMKRTLSKKIEKEVTQKMTKEFEQKLKDETDAIKKNDIMIAKDKVKSGMGIVTVPIDQRSIASSGFLTIGDRVDLLYPPKDNKQELIKFKNVKVLEIDGKRDITVLEKIQNNIPKNITVEVEYANLENLIKQITGGRQAIIIVKNQRDVIREEVASNPVEKLVEERNKNRYLNEFIKKSIIGVENRTKEIQNAKKADNKMLKFAIRTFDNANSQMSTTEDTTTKDQLRLLELAKSSLNGVKHNKTNDNNKLLQTINAAFEFNNANIQKSATGDVVTKEQLKLLELAKSSSNDAKHNDNNKLLQTMNRAFENDALVNEESSKKKLEGVITISRQTKSDTVQYDKNGNIIIAEKDKTKVLNDFDESNIQISKGVTK